MPRVISNKGKEKLKAQRATRQSAEEKWRKRPKEHQQRFKTKKENTSGLVMVRIDEKTVIYAEPGKEAEAVEKYKQTYLNQKK